MKPKIWIIIINFNGKRFLDTCLSSVLNLGYDNHKVVLVDNASTDRSVQLVETNFPQVKIIKNNDNFGFAKGNNIGIKYAIEHGANFVLLLNQDTIVERNLLNEAMKFAKEHADASLFCPQIKYRNTNKIWWAGSKLFTKKQFFTSLSPKLGYHIGKKAEDRGQFNEARQVQYITGCALFIRKQVFDTIGFFDENFFMYGEDLDLSLRASKKGLKMYYFPNSTVWHCVPLDENQGKSYAEKLKKYKNYLKYGVALILKKHYPLSMRIIWCLKLIIVVPGLFILALKK